MYVNVYTYDLRLNVWIHDPPICRDFMQNARKCNSLPIATTFPAAAVWPDRAIFEVHVNKFAPKVAQ